MESLERREVPAVIISEIMYNPGSAEAPAPNRVEWVELYNNGPAAERLRNVYLSDVTESGGTGKTAPFTVTVPARGAVVVFPDSINLADFRRAWGSGVQGVAVGRMGRSCRSDHFCLRNETAGTDGEHVALRRSDGSVIDEVNYRTKSPWPAVIGRGGPSIYLKPGAMTATANDNPGNWAVSRVGVHGARGNARTPIFDGADTGSPGTVVTGVTAAVVRDARFGSGVRNGAFAVRALESNAVDSVITSGAVPPAGHSAIDAILDRPERRRK